MGKGSKAECSKRVGGVLVWVFAGRMKTEMNRRDAINAEKKKEQNTSAAMAVRLLEASERLTAF